MFKHNLVIKSEWLMPLSVIKQPLPKPSSKETVLKSLKKEKLSPSETALKNSLKTSSH
jgi:hypothetical protein